MSLLNVKFTSKKISKVRWRPQSSSMFVTGSWDDEENNICIWNCPNFSLNSEDAEEQYESTDILEPQMITKTSFSGDVTDLKMVSGDLIFASSSVGSLAFYKFNDQKLQQEYKWENVHKFNRGPAPCTGISVKGNDVASVGEDGRLIINNFNKKQQVRQIDNSDCCSLTAISYLRHHEIVVGNMLGYLKVWDLRTGGEQPSHTLFISGDQVGVISMNLHPMQPHVLATGHEDGTLCIWDLRQERRPTTLLSGHSAAITEVQFHPLNPDYLYTCSLDGSVWQWNASGLKTISTIGNTESDQNPMTGNPWLNCDASKHRLDITSLLPQHVSCVNSLDIQNTTLLCGTDSEALYILPGIIT